MYIHLCKIINREFFRIGQNNRETDEYGFFTCF